MRKNSKIVIGCGITAADCFGIISDGLFTAAGWYRNGG